MDASGYSAAAVLTFCLILVGSYGSLINDEHEQVNAVYNAMDGHLLTERNYDQAFAVGDGAIWDSRFALGPPIGSMPLTILSAGLGAILATLHVPGSLLFGLTAVGLLATALPPNWRRGARSWVVLAPWILMWGYAPNPSHWSGHVATQFVNVAAFFATAVLVFRLLGRWNADHRAWLYPAIMLGPAMYWGQGLKYHMLSALLIAAALTLVEFRPRRWSFWLGLTMGLSMWVHVGMGAVLCAAVAAWAAVRLLRRIDRVRTWAVGVGGFAVGFAGFMMEGLYVYGNPLGTLYFRSAQTSSKLGSGASGSNSPTEAAGAAVENYSNYVERILPLDDLSRFLDNLATTYLWADVAEGQAMSLLLATPLLVTFLVGAFWAARRGSPSQRLALALVLAMTLLFTNIGVHQGGGRDLRWYSALLPVYGLIAALAIRGSWPEVRPRFVTVGTVAALLLAILWAQTLRSEVGPSLIVHYQEVYAGLWLVGMLAGLAWMLANGPVGKAVLAHAFVVFPLLWAVFFMLLLPTVLPAYQGGMESHAFLPGLDPIVEHLADWSRPTIPLPTITDLP